MKIFTDQLNQEVCVGDFVLYPQQDRQIRVCVVGIRKGQRVYYSYVDRYGRDTETFGDFMTMKNAAIKTTNEEAERIQALTSLKNL